MIPEPIMEPETFEGQLEQKWPHIEWRKPLHVAAPQGKGLACRFCIARHGLKASEIPALPQNVAEFHAHMRTYHCIPSVSHVSRNDRN